jgi:DtxR family Mn-dependent transcriptional regulator
VKNPLSQSEENYLKSIFHLSREHSVSTNELANSLGTTAASISDMLKKLAAKNLVVYEKYKGVSLSKKGREIAIKVIRKHRLWEVFLCDKLGFGWDEVHMIAEQLEHIQSEDLVNKLDEFLGFPERDPHGDSIPGRDGSFPVNHLVPLQEVEPGTWTLSGVKNDSKDFLDILKRRGLNLGVEFKLISFNSFDGSAEMEMEGESFQISHNVVQNILVKSK